MGPRPPDLTSQQPRATLTGAAGVTSQAVTVSLIDDEIDESGSRLSLVGLSNLSNAELGR